PRRDFEAAIVEKNWYLPDLAVFVLDVGKGFALKASRPGSYVFLKTKEEIGYYNVPISVMRADIEKGQIHLAVKFISAKTKAIMDENKSLMVRGIYRNGILGLPGILKGGGRIDKGKKLLLITKGIGFAPGALLASWIGEDAQVDFLMDKDKITEEIITDYLPEEIKGRIQYISLWEIFGEGRIGQSGFDLTGFVKAGGYDGVVVLASDFYIDAVRRRLDIHRSLYGEVVPKLKAYSNNFRICCGEGICGACSRVDDNGNVFKMCKCSL
ncbi:MAG: hypothetical protein RR361_06610, partial [Anaerovorax sp.]